jgi:hypothetical protein
MPPHRMRCFLNTTSSNTTKTLTTIITHPTKKIGKIISVTVDNIFFKEYWQNSKY